MTVDISGKMADPSTETCETKSDVNEESEDHSSIKTIIVSHALAVVAKVAGEDELAKQCLQVGNQPEQPEESTPEEIKETNETVDEKEEEDDDKSSNVRSTVVHAAGAIGGLIGGEIGAAAAGAIVGVVCDLGTAIVTHGEEMHGICEIIKDPTHLDAWVDGISSVVHDGMTGAGGDHQTDKPKEGEEEPAAKEPKEKEQEIPKVPESKKTVKKLSKKKSDAVESKDDDLVRIYDTCPQTMRRILKEAGIPLADYQSGRSVSELVEEIQKLIASTQNGSFTLPSYFQLVDSLHELVIVHKATFDNTTSPPGSITLTVASAEPVCFDDNLKRFIVNLLLPIHATNKVPLKVDVKKFRCIYRFRCVTCVHQGKEFNDVGQSKNFKPRFETHTGKTLREWMDREERMSALQKGNLIKGFARKSSLTLFQHPMRNHPDVAKFSDVLEIDIVHRFTDIEKDKVIRTNWEIFNQWLFKSNDETVSKD